MYPKLILLFLFAGLALTYAAERCMSGGHRYEVGDAFVAEDGCSRCICTMHGASCDREPCHSRTEPPPPPDRICKYNGHTYSPGDTFTAEDGCNDCTCNEVPSTDRVAVTCTRRPCPLIQCSFRGNVYQNGQKFEIEDGCILCECGIGEDNRPRVTCGDDRCAHTTTERPMTMSCEYNGKRYNIGQVFPSEDGCNECKCAQVPNKDAPQAICTNHRCTIGRCTYNNEEYDVGTRFEIHDGCVVCECGLADGVMRPEIQCGNNRCHTPSTPNPEQHCFYEWRPYTIGQKFEIENGCILCSCGLDSGNRPEVKCGENRCHPAETTSRPGVCRYNGREYELDQEFPSEDGCNECRCNVNDGRPVVSCTERACAPTTRHPDQKMCRYNGKEYHPGQEFPAEDKCNHCECSIGDDDKPRVHCTERACPVEIICRYNHNEYKPGDEFKSEDGCNECVCRVDGNRPVVACTKKLCPHTTPPPFRRECKVEGKHLEIGEEFPAPDGCNTCKCTQEGLGCTKKKKVPTATLR